MADAKTISELRSLGPKSAAMLARAGITSVAQLRDRGSVEAFVRARRANPGASLNLLWALESSLSGESWQQVARRHRTSLMLAVEQREQSALNRRFAGRKK
jgi:DNA transformation protein